VNILNLVSAYDRLRKDSLWKLLAADNAPVILALLQRNLKDDEASRQHFFMIAWRKTLKRCATQESIYRKRHKPTLPIGWSTVG
jgi:hypothetical protein